MGLIRAPPAFRPMDGYGKGLITESCTQPHSSGTACHPPRPQPTMVIGSYIPDVICSFSHEI
jgi:hypothetical protein